MKYLWIIIPIIIFSCNGSGDDCSEVERQLEDCKVNGKFLLEALSVVEDRLDDCQDQVDSLQDLPVEVIRDTIIKFVPLHIVDTVILRDTIIKSEVIYQRDTVCLPTAQCDTVILKKLLLVNGDTNWWFRPYVRCPLKNYQVYTDILFHGYSTGMHTESGGYKFGCMTVKVNGTDSLIYYGSRMCLDIPLKYLGDTYYPTRVMLPVDSIETISYSFYNDDYGHYNGEYEDVNIYMYGLLVDSVDYFLPERIEAEVYPGWSEDSTHIRMFRKGTITINLK